VQDKLRGTSARIVSCFISLAGMLLSFVLVWRGGQIAYDAWFYGERMSTVLGTPTVIPYSFIPIGFFVLGLAFFANFAEAFDGRSRTQDLT
jgi:TRAP-type C4-dicarboxylate transport system permease small subunit